MKPDIRKRLLEVAVTMRRNTRQRLLDLMTARIGRALVGARLDVPLVLLDDWISGAAPIPDAKVLALIDLIDETGETG